MKQYFLQFDFWNKNVNKFFFGIVRINLAESSLPDICREIIKREFHDISPYDVEIKVNACNLV